MKTKTEREERLIDERAERIGKDYSYMDNMPLEGWMWEFARRSREYREKFELIKRVVINQISKGTSNPEDHKSHAWDERRVKDAMEINDMLSGFPKRMLHFIFENEKEPSNKECFLAINYPFEVTHFIPRPEIPYPNFGSDLCNYIEGMNPVICKDYESIKTKITDLAGEIDCMDTSDIAYVKSWFIGAAHSILWELTPYTPEETVYVAFTKRTKKEDIKNEIESVFHKYWENPEKRENPTKWKYYLIAYDLKEKRLEYPEIADIMSKAYPNIQNLFDTGNIDNYWIAAHKLIDLGEYEEHLPGKFQKK